MNKKQIERYFKILDKIYAQKCKIILTGAAAGVLYGNVRATMDIDFSAEATDWESFSKAAQEASMRIGIEVQYAEDIDRWTSITLMDYKKHTYVYQQLGNIEIRLMEPPYWALGKLSRYLDQDVSDMVKVFKKTGTPWQKVASVSGQALHQSPQSTACFLFRKQVEDFFKQYGGKIWGKTFELNKAITLFQQEAGIKI